MNFTYRQLSYIHAAALKGSIAAAAQSLRISQSSIGAAIDRFEATHNVELFVRQPSKGLKITPTGRLLIDRIGHILSETNAFEDHLLGLKAHISGELVIGCFAPLAPHVLPSVIRTLTQRHENLSIRVLEGDLRMVNNMLEAGQADIILSYDLGLPIGVKFVELCEAPPHAIFSDHDDLSNESSVTMKQLANRPMVLLDLPESRAYFDLLFLSVGQTPNVVLRSGTYETVRGFVATGIGYSILNIRPSHPQTYTGEKIVCVPISDPLPIPKIGIGTRFTERTSNRVLEFETECRRTFSQKRIRGLVVESDTSIKD